MSLELAEPATEAEWAAYYRLRYERLRKPLGLPPGSERDDPAEAGSSHVIAKLDGRVVGAACWAVGLRNATDRAARQMFVRLRQIAVDPECERSGVGSAITRHIEERARALGAVELVANARTERTKFFLHNGWIEQGEGVTLFDQVDSMSMVKPLR